MLVHLLAPLYTKYETFPTGSGCNYLQKTNTYAMTSMFSIILDLMSLFRKYVFYSYILYVNKYVLRNLIPQLSCNWYEIALYTVENPLVFCVRPSVMKFCLLVTVLTFVYVSFAESSHQSQTLYDLLRDAEDQSALGLNPFEPQSGK